MFYNLSIKFFSFILHQIKSIIANTCSYYKCEKYALTYKALLKLKSNMKTKKYIFPALNKQKHHKMQFCLLSAMPSTFFVSYQLKNICVFIMFMKSKANLIVTLVISLFFNNISEERRTFWTTSAKLVIALLQHILIDLIALLHTFFFTQPAGHPYSPQEEKKPFLVVNIKLSLLIIISVISNSS